MLLTAVHSDDNEVTNDSGISHVSCSTFNRQQLRPIASNFYELVFMNDRTIVTSQSLQYDFY